MGEPSYHKVPVMIWWVTFELRGISSGLEHRGGPTQPGVKTRWPGIKCFLFWQRHVLLLADTHVYSAGSVVLLPHTQVVWAMQLPFFLQSVITDDNNVIFVFKDISKSVNDAAWLPPTYWTWSYHSLTSCLSQIVIKNIYSCDEPLTEVTQSPFSYFGTIPHVADPEWGYIWIIYSQ